MLENAKFRSNSSASGNIYSSFVEVIKQIEMIATLKERMENI